MANRGRGGGEGEEEEKEEKPTHIEDIVYRTRAPRSRVVASLSHLQLDSTRLDQTRLEPQPHLRWNRHCQKWHHTTADRLSIARCQNISKLSAMFEVRHASPSRECHRLHAENTIANRIKPIRRNLD